MWFSSGLIAVAPPPRHLAAAFWGFSPALECVGTAVSQLLSVCHWHWNSGFKLSPFGGCFLFAKLAVSCCHPIETHQHWNSCFQVSPFCSCCLFATGIKLPVSCCHLLASLLELTGIRTAVSSCHHLAKLLEPVSEQLHISSCHHSADLWYSPVRKQLFLAAKL